jgi:hypothetical protein
LKKIDFGQTLHLLGNLGVIVGILLLVYELNQNREMMKAQTRNEMSQGLIHLFLEFSNDTETASIWRRGRAGEDLTEDEQTRFSLMTFSELRHHENVHYQYRNGLYDQTEYLAQRKAWRGLVFNNKGLVEIYCSYRFSLSSEFVADVDELLTVNTCE